MMKVVVVTGAGISQPSGIPTFRDELTGFWTTTEWEARATARNYRQYLPELWQFWYEMRNTVLEAEPNLAHRCLLPDVTEPGMSVRVVTQNVDGLHQRAGSRPVTEIHGTLFRDRCVRPTCGPSWEDTLVRGGVPQCVRCHRPARPAMVMFGETLPGDARREAQTLLKSADVVVWAGTSGIVHPVAGWVGYAQSRSIPQILVNWEEWEDMSAFTHWFGDDSIEVELPRVMSLVASGRLGK